MWRPSHCPMSYGLDSALPFWLHLPTVKPWLLDSVSPSGCGLLVLLVASADSSWTVFPRLLVDRSLYDRSFASGYSSPDCWWFLFLALASAKSSCPSFPRLLANRSLYDQSFASGYSSPDFWWFLFLLVGPAVSSCPSFPRLLVDRSLYNLDSRNHDDAICKLSQKSLFLRGNHGFSFRNFDIFSFLLIMFML